MRGPTAVAHTRHVPLFVRVRFVLKVLLPCLSCFCIILCFVAVPCFAVFVICGSLPFRVLPRSRVRSRSVFHSVSCSARRVSHCCVWWSDRFDVIHHICVLLSKDCCGLFVDDSFDGFGVPQKVPLQVSSAWCSGFFSRSVLQPALTVFAHGGTDAVFVWKCWGPFPGFPRFGCLLRSEAVVISQSRKGFGSVWLWVGVTNDIFWRERCKACAGENYSAEVRKHRRTYQPQMEAGMPRFAANAATTEMPDVDPFRLHIGERISLPALALPRRRVWLTRGAAANPEEPPKRRIRLTRFSSSGVGVAQ